MDRPLRILHLADSHIGSQLPARPRRRDERRRGDDIVHSYQRVLQRAREFDVDLVLHAGDVFDEPNPSDAAISAASNPLLSLAADGFPVVIIPGNHERSVLPGSLFLSHPNVHIFGIAETRVFTLRGRRVAIVGIPCIRRHSAARFAAVLDETRWAETKAELNILLTHQAFDSSTCGPANYRFRKGNEDVVDRAHLPSAFHYVAAGHIHRHQVLGTRDHDAFTFDGCNVPVVYSGSVDRISFAEQDEPKGCMLLEESERGFSHRFIEHEVRAMMRFPLDVSGLSRSAIRAAAVAWSVTLPRGALAQVRLSGRTTPTEMRGLQLAAEIHNARPDLLFSVSAQAVVFESQRVAVANTKASRENPAPAVPAARPQSLFDVLADSGLQRVICKADRLKDLPASPATYAFHDAAGRLLYIGKATNLRARVRQHLAARPSGAFFEGWTRDISWIEARLAFSEIEALLVEAELIRIHRPPFNRQMRQWERYCYLIEGLQPYGQLSIVRDLPMHDPNPRRELIIYGPYRSRWEAAAIAEAVARHTSLAYCEDLALPAALRRKKKTSASRMQSLPIALNLCQRYFNRECAGPCADRVAVQHYATLRSARAALLNGEDDSTFAAAEYQMEALAEEPKDLGDAEKAALRFVQTLRHAFETGRVLREARGLLGATIVLPAPPDLLLKVTIADETLQFTHAAILKSETQAQEERGSSKSALVRADAPALALGARIAAQHSAQTAMSQIVVPKARLDLLATLVRHQRKEQDTAAAAEGPP